MADDPSAIDPSPTLWGALRGRHAPLGTAFAWALLALCLVLTAAGWKYAEEDARLHAWEQFEFRINAIDSSLNERMAAYELALRGGVALFSSVGAVSRAQWRDYVGALNLQKNYPGIQGLGYAQAVAGADLQGHEQAVRGQGFPDYAVRPPGVRPVYTPVVYLEPFDARNRRAFGYDTFSEPVRRAAQERARDTGQTAITGKVTLVQETGEDVQAGFLMFVACYAPLAPDFTPQERLRALTGYVYSPFRMNDFMQGLTGKDIDDLGVEIFDDADLSEHSLMYRSEALAALADSGRPALFTSVRRVEIAGYPWTMRVASLPAFEATIDRRVPRLIMAAGLCLSLLLFGVAISLANSQARAVLLANKMTASLRASEDRGRIILQTATDGIHVLDENGRLVLCSPSFAQMLGYTPGELAGLGVADWDIQFPAGEVVRAVREIIASPRTFETQYRGKDGAVLDVEISARGVALDGRMLLYASARDVTNRKRAQKALRDLEQSYREMIEFAPIGIFKSSPEGRYLMANGRLAEMYGYDSADDLLESVRDIPAQIYVDQEDRETIRKTLAHGVVDRMEVRRRRKDGSVIWASLSMRAVRDRDGAVLHYEGFARDVTRRRQAEDALLESEERYYSFFTSGEAKKLIIDPAAGVIADANPAAVEFYGYPLNRLLGMSIRELNAMTQEEHEALLAAMSGQDNWRRFLRQRLAGGDFRDVEVYANPISYKGQNYIMATIHDVTELKQMEAKLQELATLDSLTGLNNRRHFLELGGLLFETALRYGSPLAVVMFDIDHFKEVNDFYGHEAGDAVLKDLSRTTLASFRSADVLGRLGGEEFAVVMPETDNDEAVSAAERFRAAVEAAVVWYEGESLSITVSCGVALLGAHDFTLEGLLKKADMALYKAKKQGRNRVAPFAEQAPETA
ncbi:MAG: CHASE domain-containing protein [Desulfovibrionaceae bacterium]|nr:CHASE domain-containing protein [Desulfovibrionaceae bacterium]MBF0514334.1 CHASE domain-containing protein [Desulfovibrionaceae bacterium]